MSENVLLEGLKEPTTDETLLQMVGDLEYRLCLMELGVSADDL